MPPKCSLCGRDASDTHECPPERDTQLGLQWITTTLPAPFDKDDDDDDEDED